MYSIPPPTTGAIESIFWLEVHQADINGATTATSEFPSQSDDIDHFFISAKVLIQASWSSFLGFRRKFKNRHLYSPYVFPAQKSAQQPQPYRLYYWVLYVSGAPHLVIRLFLQNAVVKTSTNLLFRMALKKNTSPSGQQRRFQNKESTPTVATRLKHPAAAP